MTALHAIADLFLHLDKHLLLIIQQYGAWTYLLMFFIVFCETGVVLAPFLPGDSLLFAAGAFAASGSLNFPIVLVVLWAAGVLGDFVNYNIGRYFGERLLRYDSRIIRKEHLEKTHAFFAKYGGKAIILGRFVPVVRTLAPFVAGIGRMSRRKFMLFNIIGGTAWALLFVGGGYLFGNIPAVRDHFSIAILCIVAISLIPGFVEFVKHRRSKHQ